MWKWDLVDHKGPRNKVIRTPGKTQSNQVGKIAAVIAVLKMVPPYQPVRICLDSKHVIKGLTTHIENWENDGWII